MNFILSPEERAYLSNLTGGARRMWLLSPPEGVTSAVVYVAARELGFIVDVEVGERRIELSAILSGLRESDWLALRKACFARVGIKDPEAWERARMTSSPAYTRWLGNLRQYQRARGIAA